LPDFKQESWFAAIFGGQSFGWIYDLWYALGGDLNRAGGQWVTGLDARVVWWIVVAGAAWLLLSRTQAGNWIYATGDNRESARANGVPVDKVRISLFMLTAFCSTIFAACQVFDTNSADAAKGNLKELEAIAIAVVGGTLMTGGYGSVIGVVFGAVTFGLVANAVFFIPAIDGSYYRVFVGIVLLVAVFLNEGVRKRITGGL
jgi:simple sugar transport system permease protein